MAGQVGWKSEATWGTPVVVDQFVPVLEASQTIDEGYMQPQGIRGGRRTYAPPKLGRKVVGGQMRLELPNVTVAPLLKHLLGAVSTSGAGPYEHTYTPGAQTGANKSLTIQTGIGDASGTVQPFTHEGAKIGEWELGLSVGEFAILSASWTAEDYTTATALAAASYAAGLDPFTFVEGALTVDGAPVASARAASVKANKGLRTDRHVIGARTIREQLEQDRWDFTGSVTCDFEGLTMFNHIAAADELALVFSLDNGTDSLEITANIVIVGDPPSLSTNGLEEQTLNFQCVSSTSDAAAITAVLTNTDASAV